jgi:hypothetical protein
MRSTRENELVRDFPLHVACAWIGNSQPVAAKHYLQVTDADFAKATGAADVAQNAVQYSSESHMSPSASERLSRTFDEVRRGRGSVIGWNEDEV